MSLALLCCGMAFSAEQQPGDQRPGDERQAPAGAGQEQQPALDKEVRAETRQQDAQSATAYNEQTDWDVVEWLLLGAAAIGIFLTVVLERPWLIPHLSDENTEAIGQMLREPIREGGIILPTANLAFTNHGRTPGWITERCLVLRRMPPDLPPEPPYPEEKIERGLMEPVPSASPVYQLSNTLFFGPGSVESIRRHEDCLVFFGYVKYRGILRRYGTKRETRFCWVTKVEVLREDSDPSRHLVIVRFERGGPPNWNRYS